jgi:hypothetical protein
MPFGLANTPSTFQAYINKALGDLVDSICVIYLDDILIYSRNKQEYIEHIKQVLQWLHEYRLYAKASKCKFHMNHIEFLGFIITPAGIVMDPVHVKVIKEWPELESYRDIQVFLGFMNLYRHFIWNFSQLACVLNVHMLQASQPPQ